MRRLIVAIASVGTLLAGPALAKKNTNKTETKTTTTTSTSTQPPQQGQEQRTSMQENTSDQKQATESTGQAKSNVSGEMNQAAESTKQGAQQVGHGVSSAAHEVGQETKEAARNATEDIGQAAKSVGNKVSGAGNEMATGAPTQGKGILGNGNAVHNSLTNNPLGFFSGEGLNLMYARALSRKISGDIGANYSRVNSGDGSATVYGFTLGADWFLIGQHNEGLRIGPRVNFNAGNSTIGRNTLDGEFSAAGELGYNWIASNGITLGAGAGVAGRLGGALDIENNNQNESAGRFYLKPYGRLNVGYSW